MRLHERVDRYQRSHRWVGLPLAVLYKFYDDQALYLAALLTYYGFLSLFPLLLILVAVLSSLLSNDPVLRQEVLNSALSKFPVIGDQIVGNIHSFHGSGAALAAGIAGSLYGSLGVAQAAQYALNKIWAVPRHARPDPFRSRLRGLLFLLLLALGLCAFTLLSVAASQTYLFGVPLQGGVWIAARAASVCLNTGLLVTSYRLLTYRALPLRGLVVIALGAACVWQGCSGWAPITSAMYCAGHSHLRHVRHRPGAARLAVCGGTHLYRSCRGRGGPAATAVAAESAVRRSQTGSTSARVTVAPTGPTLPRRRSRALRRSGCTSAAAQAAA